MVLTKLLSIPLGICVERKSDDEHRTLKVRTQGPEIDTIRFEIPNNLQTVFS